MHKKIAITVLLGLVCILLFFQDVSFANVTPSRESRSIGKKDIQDKKESKEDTESCPCDGLLSILNRPTIADSACVVPLNKVVAEMGYTYYNLSGGGVAHTFPQWVLRFGLLGSNEFVSILPTYVIQSVEPTSGWTATTLGLKHRFLYTKNQVVTFEALFTLPSGSYAFGSAGLGTTINGIFEYELTKTIALTTMLGVSSLTTPRQDGGERYNSFNPDVVLSWHPKDRIQFYGEIYGATSTGPGEGPGSNFDVGVQYLLTKKLEVDLSFGQRIFGKLYDFNNYVSVGLGVMT